MKGFGTPPDVPVSRAAMPRVLGQYGDASRAHPVNLFQHVVLLAEHLRVPESQDLQPESSEVGVAGLVAAFLTDVRIAVEFDHEQRRGAEEVGDVRPDRVLTAELEPREASVP